MISFDKNDIFIVTGASSGIGKSTAILLNELGATVVAIARNKDRLNKMKAKCKYPENMHLEIKDLTENIEELPNFVTKLKEKYGKFQGMAYCAGIAEIVPIQLVEEEKIKKIFDTNYFAPIFMIKGFADKDNNTGNRASIVVIASASAILSDKGHTSYSGSKAAIIQSCETLAKELAFDNIRLNCVSPTDVLTKLTSFRNPDEYLFYPFGAGHVQDVSNMIIYLLSSKSEWITAQNYIIDCGFITNKEKLKYPRINTHTHTRGGGVPFHQRFWRHKTK